MRGPKRPCRAAGVAAAVATLGAAVFAAAEAEFSAAGWKQADPAYRLELPRDHAAHPAHRIGWWYYTGNVAARAARLALTDGLWRRRMSVRA